jgi:hypothetical protein
MVHLVQVDVVGLQPLQRGVAGTADVAGGQEGVVGPVAHRAIELGGDDRLVTAPLAAGEPPADDLLGDALTLLPAVDVGRVEEVDPDVERAIHDRVGVFLGGLGTEVHRSQAEPADREAAAAEVRVSPCRHPAPKAVRRRTFPDGVLLTRCEARR